MHKSNKVSLTGISLVLGSLIMSCGDAGTAAHNLKEDPSVQGTFLSECHDSALLDLAEQNTLILHGAKVEYHQAYFTKDNCDASSLGAVVAYEGDFSIESKENNSGTIDVKLEKVTLTTKTPDVTKKLNDLKFCGRNDYAENEARDLTEFDDNFLCPIKEIPAMRFGSFHEAEGKLQIDNNILDMTKDMTDRKTLDQHNVLMLRQ